MQPPLLNEIADLRCKLLRRKNVLFWPCYVTSCNMKASWQQTGDISAYVCIWQHITIQVDWLLKKVRPTHGRLGKKHEIFYKCPVNHSSGTKSFGPESLRGFMIPSSTVDFGRFVRSVLRALTCSVLKLIEIVIFMGLLRQPFWLQLVLTIFVINFQLFKLFRLA